MKTTTENAKKKIWHLHWGTLKTHLGNLLSVLGGTGSPGHSLYNSLHSGAGEPVPPSYAIRFLNPNCKNPSSAAWLGTICKAEKVSIVNCHNETCSFLSFVELVLTVWQCMARPVGLQKGLPSFPWRPYLVVKF